MVQALPAAAKAQVFLEVGDESDRQELVSDADVTLEWLYRRGTRSDESNLLIDRVAAFLYVGGYVNALSAFPDAPAVINGASDLFVELYGDAGRHARAAVAVAGLPKNATVEIQVTVAIKA